MKDIKILPLVTVAQKAATKRNQTLASFLHSVVEVHLMVENHRGREERRKREMRQVRSMTSSPRDQGGIFGCNSISLEAKARSTRPLTAF